MRSASFWIGFLLHSGEIWEYGSLWSERFN